MKASRQKWQEGVGVALTMNSGIARASNHDQRIVILVIGLQNYPKPGAYLVAELVCLDRRYVTCDPAPPVFGVIAAMEGSDEHRFFGR